MKMALDFYSDAMLHASMHAFEKGPTFLGMTPSFVL
jgi:hypothetical protein